MIWWYWLLLGLALLGAEMVMPSGFFLMFFGLAALVVGAATGLGLEVPSWLQWVLFSGLAIVSLLLFRDRLLSRMKVAPPKAFDVDGLIGETAIHWKTYPLVGSAKRSCAEQRGLHGMPATRP